MWINNYDDPEEMTLEEALCLLGQHGWKEVTEEANRQNGTSHTWVFEGPQEYGGGVYYCDEEFEVIEIPINWALVYIECRQCKKSDLPLNQETSLCVRCTLDNENKRKVVWAR
jgi:hypothetical protein